MNADGSVNPVGSPAVLCFGEILWDRIGDHESLGGAPFNVAAHAARCGLNAQLYSRVGGDARGRRIMDELARFGVGRRWLQQDTGHATGVVEVSLGAAGEPAYEIVSDVAWDFIEPPRLADENELRGAGFAALVCGTLAQRTSKSREALFRLRHLLRETPVFYDINLRMPHTPMERVLATLPGVAWVKVNEAEADGLSRALVGYPLEPADLFEQLSRHFGVTGLLMTRGEHGSVAVTAKQYIECPAPRVKVAATVGAGDALTAVFLAGWLRGWNLVQVLSRANRVAAWVASQTESVPDYPPDLSSELGIR